MRSNCVAMVKLIEDVIFEDDNYKIVESITIKSRKAKFDNVEIEISLKHLLYFIWFVFIIYVIFVHR